MKTENNIVLEKLNAEIGAFIDNAEANNLRTNFEEKYPLELKTILISKRVLDQVFKENPDCCGIRFMYGLSERGNAKSKLIILVPCRDGESSLNPLPVVNADGYLIHSGERISLLQTFEFMSNHVSHFKEVDGDLNLRQVPRACFFGSLKLIELIASTEAEGINFYFGYDIDSEITQHSLRYRVVLETTFHKNYSGLRMFMDHAGLIPPDPEDSPAGGDCLITNIANTEVGDLEDVNAKLNVYRKYRDEHLLNENSHGALVEMYYFTSPSILDKIFGQPNKDQLLKEIYENDIKPCEKLINEAELEKTKQLFEQSMNRFLSKYVLN